MYYSDFSKINLYYKRETIATFFIVAAVFLLWSILAPNLTETLLSLFLFYITVKVTFKPGIPLYVMAGFMLQVLSITIKIFYANSLGIPFEEVFSYYKSTDHLSQAFYYSSIGILAYLLGLHLNIKKVDAAYFRKKIEKELVYYDPLKAIYFYLGFTLLMSFLFTIRFALPGLNTFIVVFNHLKIGVLLFTFFVVHFHKRHQKTLYFILFFEFILGFSSFFSGFKDIIFYFIIAYISFYPLIKRKHLLILIPSFYFIFQLGIIWTAVKGDYRDFLTQGQSIQKAVVSDAAALNKFWELTTELNEEDKKSSLDAFIDRIGYTDFFSLTIEHVPEKQPYENGEVWQTAINHILKPRLLFPDKPAIDDSEHTNQYTGLELADSAKGASHSLGYVADSYIDFGPVGMHIPIFLLGLITGFFFVKLLLHSGNFMWGIILTGPFFFLTNVYGMNTVKVVGHLFSIFLVLWFTRRVIYKVIDPLLRKNQPIDPIHDE